ncbi:MAG: choice-of-anchor D domain-containing protein [Luteolibacter sp.]
MNGSSPTAGNGTTWAKPFVTLRDALDASLPGDQVYLAKGTYYPDDGVSGFIGDRELAFEVNGLKIYGGFKGTEANLSQRDPVANPTILSGEIWPVTPDTLGFERYWSLHVVVLKSSSTLDGLTIEKGRANGDAAPYNQGGGVLAPSGTTLTLVNCTFSSNYAAGSGGAVFGNVVATGSTFSDNLVNNEFLYTTTVNKPHHWLFSPDCSGGAIAGDVTAVNCNFLNNQLEISCLDVGTTSSATGGAISGSKVNVTGCLFDGNIASSSSFNFPKGGSDATSRGGAISATNVTATKCTFVNNVAVSLATADESPDPKAIGHYTAIPTTTGGVIAGQIIAVNCTFDKNVARTESPEGDEAKTTCNGSVLYVEGTSSVANCTFTENAVANIDETLGRGGFTIVSGGVCVTANAVLPIANCTFYNNLTHGVGAAISCAGSVNVLSNIFWFDDDDVEDFFKDAMIHVGGKARISNRTYPTPSTETINLVKGGFDSITSGLGANIDFGEPPDRTFINLDPKFIDPLDPIGVDGLWRTTDDGLRLDIGSPAIGKGSALFLPNDTADLDEDGNKTETLPIDIANFVRIQGGTLDLGAYEQGDKGNFPDIQVEQPVGTPLVDGSAAIDFSSSQGIAKTFVIRNIGPANLKNISVTGDGVDIASFKFTQPGLTLLASGASTSFTVTFLPRFSGIRQATIHILSNDDDESSFDIDLSGDALLPDIGVEYPVGTPLVDETSTVGFGNISSISSVTKRFTVTNNGLGNLSIQNILTSGTNAKNFTTSAPVQSLLVPGAKTTFDVTFTPAGTGSRTASIVIQNSDPDGESSFVIKVNGGGIGAPEISVNQPFSKELVSGDTNAFGSVKVSSSYSKTFVIRNIGSAVLKNISVSLSGSGTFTATKLAVKQLDPGSQLKFTVTFKPTSLGGKTAVLKIASNDADESLINITLTGKGVPKSSTSAFTLAAASAGFTAAPAVDHAAEAVTVTTTADGSKYLVLTIEKTAGWELSKHTVEVSPNLVNWFSGANHTTTLLDSPTVLKVRDNTPINGGEKRYIRLK